MNKGTIRHSSFGGHAAAVIALAALGAASARTVEIGDFFVPPAYRDTYCRCDLHPRWRPDGRQLAFNSVHEGTRQIYVIDARNIVFSR